MSGKRGHDADRRTGRMARCGLAETLSVAGGKDKSEFGPDSIDSEANPHTFVIA